jgi:hypothetical protein
MIMTKVQAVFAAVAYLLALLTTVAAVLYGERPTLLTAERAVPTPLHSTWSTPVTPALRVTIVTRGHTTAYVDITSIGCYERTGYCVAWATLSVTDDRPLTAAVGYRFTYGAQAITGQVLIVDGATVEPAEFRLYVPRTATLAATPTRLYPYAYGE